MAGGVRKSFEWQAALVDGANNGVDHRINVTFGGPQGHVGTGIEGGHDGVGKRERIRNRLHAADVIGIDGPVVLQGLAG